MNTTKIACGAIVVVASFMCGCGTTSTDPKINFQGKLAPESYKAVEALASAPRFDPLGFTAHNSSTISEATVDRPIADLKIGERLQIISVEQDSPASLAGLRRGDVIISIDEKNVTKGKQGVLTLRNEIIPNIDWTQPVGFLVIRDGTTLQFEFPAAQS